MDTGNMEISQGLIVPLRLLIITSTLWIVYAFFALQNITKNHEAWRARVQITFITIFVGMASVVFSGEVAYTYYTIIVALFVLVLYIIIRIQVTGHR